jgi:hypothetical protein
MAREDRRKKREEREEKRRKKRTARIISKQREREEREKELEEKVDTPKNEQVAAPKKSEDKSQDSSESSIESRRRKKPVPTLSPEGERARTGEGIRWRKEPEGGELFELGGKKYRVLRPKGYGPPDPSTKIIGPSDNKESKATNAKSQAIQNMGTQKIEDPKLEAESQAIQNIANDDATGTQTNVVNAVANSGDPEEKTLSNLEKAKEIGEGAKEQENKNSAAQINNEDLGIALKGDEIKATPGASDFTKKGISTTQAPSYDPSGKQVEQDIMKQQRAQTPLAIEKLALQDYFPNAGRNIAVGTFTGSRIGSQTIYSGYGALAPMGLIDARKRAIVKRDKEKRAKLDEFLSIPNTYKVYHDFAKPYAAGKFAEIGAKHGWDYDKIMSDPDALKEVYRLKGVYETFEKAGAAAEELKELMQDPTKEVYISPKIRKKIWTFTRGQVNPEPYLSGKRDINEITKGMVPYPSFIKFFNDNSSKWFAEGRQGQMPISFKDYGPLTPEKLNEMKDGIDKFRINQDNDAYVELVKKHFAIDTNLVETWAKTNGVPLDDEIIEVWEDFFVNMIPPDIIEREITHVSNKSADRALGYARLNQERLQNLSLHNRIAEEIDSYGAPSDNVLRGSERANRQAEYLTSVGLTNLKGQGSTDGIYAEMDLAGEKTPILYVNPKQTNMIYLDGKLTTISDAISTVKKQDPGFFASEDERQKYNARKEFLEDMQNNQGKIAPVRIEYRVGGRNKEDGTLYTGNSTNGLGDNYYDEGVYASSVSNAVTGVEKTDTNNRTYIDYVPVDGIQVATGIGKIGSQQGTWDANFIAGETTNPRYTGKSGANR